MGDHLLPDSGCWKSPVPGRGRTEVPVASWDLPPSCLHPQNQPWHGAAVSLFSLASSLASTFKGSPDNMESAGMVQSDRPIVKTVSESVTLIASAESLLPCKARGPQMVSQYLHGPWD